jgi:hypothetical protein
MVLFLTGPEIGGDTGHARSVELGLEARHRHRRRSELRSRLVEPRLLQRLAEGHAGGKPPPRILREGAREERIDHRREPLDAAADPGGRLGDAGLHRRRISLVTERAFTAQAFVEDDGGENRSLAASAGRPSACSGDM